MKSLYPKRFVKQSSVTIPNELESKRVKDILKSKDKLNEIPATDRQLFALHLASNRTIDTRGMKIDKKTAGELIGTSKRGENITHILTKMIGDVNNFGNVTKPNDVIEKAMIEEDLRIVNLEKEFKKLNDKVLSLEKQLFNYKKRENEMILFLINLLNK